MKDENSDKGILLKAQIIKKQKVQHTVWPPRKEDGTADPKGLKASHRRPTHLGLQVQARGPKIKSLLAGHLQIISAAEIRLESLKNAFGMC